MQPLLHLLLSPKPPPSLWTLTTLPPSQPDGAATHTLFVLWSFTTLLHCTACIHPLSNPSISSNFEFYSSHRFSPPYTHSPFLPCYSLRIIGLIFLPSSSCWHPYVMLWIFVTPYTLIVTMRGGMFTCLTTSYHACPILTAWIGLGCTV